jgi:type I site-specific restriction endonuclease
MRTALNNLNADLVQQFPDYVCRVTADEGDIGRGHMQRFQDVETRTPVILTTSQLLTTGLDAPTCRNVVLVRLVNSMVEFKQIIGRGTRVRDDYGKLWFNILDYTGTATRNCSTLASTHPPTSRIAGSCSAASSTAIGRGQTSFPTTMGNCRAKRSPMRN